MNESMIQYASLKLYSKIWPPATRRSKKHSSLLNSMVHQNSDHNSEEVEDEPGHAWT